MREVGFLPLPPRRLGQGVGVGATFDDFDHCGAESSGDLVARDLPALIFDGVVQQRGDGLILVAAVLHHQRGHGQQVRQVRLARKLPPLIGMQRGGVGERFGESGGQGRTSIRRLTAILGGLGISLHFSPYRANRQRSIRWGRHSCLPEEISTTTADRNVCPTV